MKSKIVLALLALPLVAIDPALAQAYRWKDSSGKTVISDDPPPRSPDTRQMRTQPFESTPEGAKTYQEKDAEFRKRLDANREKNEKDRQDAADQAALKENCDRHRGALIALTSGQRLSTLNSKGEQQSLGDAEREREAARARDFIAKNCK